MGAIIYLDAYKKINVHFPKTNVPTRVHKNGHNSICDHETCTTGFSRHRATSMNYYVCTAIIT